MALSSLAQRVRTAAVLVPLILAPLFLLSPRGWALALLAVMALAAYEWGKLAGFSRHRALVFIAGVLLIGLYLLFAPAAGFVNGWPKPVVVAVCGAATAFWLLAAPAWLAGQSPPRGWPVMMLLGWIVLIGAWMAIAELQARSPWLVLAAMAVVWIADTAAYFTGRKFGKRKLAPSISPNKTWEGVAGGLAAVAVYALILTQLSPSAGYPGARSAAGGSAFVLFVILLAAASIVGDLVESLLKRQAGLKDSGALLPGHGGVLDRIDALLSAMPPAALAAAYFLPKAT